MEAIEAFNVKMDSLKDVAKLSGSSYTGTGNSSELYSSLKQSEVPSKMIGYNHTVVTRLLRTSLVRIVRTSFVSTFSHFLYGL